MLHLGQTRSLPITVLVVATELLSATIAWAEVDWQPERTWIFAVGVLQWHDPNVWPGMATAQKNRRDVEVVQHFQKSGVANNRIVYLQDQHATRNRIHEELTAQLAKTRQDDLLVFYFTGHGFRDRKNHEVHLANYDATDGASAWRVRSLFDTLEAHFKGSRVVLMADCCYSGGLVDEARSRKTQLGYACLCSSFSHNSSTGNWTFSDSLLAGLRGQPEVDLNADGEIDVNELGRYSELEMAFVERQKAVYEHNHSFPERWRIATPHKARMSRQGDRVEVEWKGKWYRATILESSGDRSKVHCSGFEAAWDDWVGPERIRPFQPKHLAEGAAVDVLWKRDHRWYPAKVVRSWYGLTFVHYEGYPDEWDEWVNFDMIRTPAKTAR